jgi:hypothetical protein
LRAHEDRFHADVHARLSSATRERLDALLRPENVGVEDGERDDMTDSAPALLLRLRGSPGRPNLASMQDELANLELIRRGPPDGGSDPVCGVTRRRPFLDVLHSTPASAASRVPCIRGQLHRRRGEIDGATLS